MKYYETHFEEYVHECDRMNLHPRLSKFYQERFPSALRDLKNLIFYGPTGVGKYTQMLKSISRYSPTDLKYEKKISLTSNKQQYFFKISDIHFEVDMSLLGCNSKTLWHEVYQQLVDIVSAKADKTGIVVCKYFHEIHSELLENFYSYMQSNKETSIDIKFILLTEQLSFIPDNILNCCQVIQVSRPSKTAYTRCLKKHRTLPSTVTPEGVTNIKGLQSYNEALMSPHRFISNKIIQSLVHPKDLHFLKFRDILYDVFIYNLDITSCVWYILSVLIEQERLKQDQMSVVLLNTYRFMRRFNNNYRIISHVEHYFLSLIPALQCPP